jgi:maltose 6'-phosphate phosphatase
MKKDGTFIHAAVLAAALVLLLPFHASAWWWSDGYQCDLDDGKLNIMTINLLFSEIEERDDRLRAIADYATANNIHIILLQEVVGGLLVDTQNSAKDLQDHLGRYGGNYNLKTAFETGLPGLLAVANAVLSRCEIKFTLVKRLPLASEIEFGGHSIKLPRNVQMARIKIPGSGNIHVYNTHWCAGCSVAELSDHWQETFEFINAVEDFLPGENPVIFGGDLNLDRFRNAEEENLYQWIVDDLGEGFSDAYADFVGEPDSLCKQPPLVPPDDDYPDKHCTIGVSDYGDSTERRIDYIFVKNVNADAVLRADVVFNPSVSDPSESDPSVSDHSAVVVSVQLP